LASFNRHWHRFDLHFGFDELTGKVQLYAQILAAQLTLECFEATLANLLDHAEFWQRLLPCDGDREAVAAVGMRV
ncbi:TPA: type III secretion system regulatory chaperone ExsC, partial [Pseudomonas aeruginosa]|nr:type III secretion system regulatory chaperone ExsC [Pseudomonas aeruginosa]EKW7314494.1 type III secretion system regulatory chaperone ExsC [Pseudomonas aeruginosa]HCI2991425.1 type III secretion system regulatory chaperone ExsC [Pseudomonas aeruginosa]